MMDSEFVASVRFLLGASLFAGLWHFASLRPAYYEMVREWVALLIPILGAVMLISYFAGQIDVS